MANVRVFTECLFHAHPPSYPIPCGLSVEDYSIPELVLHGDTPEPLISGLKALDVLLLVAERANLTARGTRHPGVSGVSSAVV
jgi:hypothetical protein